ncbi:MAG: MFS transporter [Sphingomonadales bacterium]|nr:MFS transporter [Sphingomonadales bacterium]
MPATTRPRETPPGEHVGLAGRRRGFAVLSLTTGTIVTTVAGSMVNIALPSIAREFRVSSAATVLVVTVYQLVLMMALLPLSALGNRFGHRTIYQRGLIVFVSATLLSFLARSLPFLLAVRALQALGAAAAMSVSSALIREAYPANRLGRGLSLNTMMAAGFATLAPSLGGALLAVARWPWLFAALVPFGVISIIAGRRSLPDPVIHHARYDMRGAALCALTFGLAVTGLELAMHGGVAPAAAALIAAGLGMGVVFVRRELRLEQPMLPVDLLRAPAIAMPVTGLFAAYLGSMIMLVNLPFRLQQGLHLSPAAAGVVMAAWPSTSMIVAPTAGLLSDRYPAAALGALGMGIASAGLVALAFLPAAPGQIDLMWRVLLCGVGFGFFFSPNSRQIIGAAPRPRMAAAGALTTTTRGAGQTLGASIAGAVLALGIGNGPAASLLAAGLAATAGLCCVLTLRRR